MWKKLDLLAFLARGQPKSIFAEFNLALSPRTTACGVMLGCLSAGLVLVHVLCRKKRIRFNDFLATFFKHRIFQQEGSWFNLNVDFASSSRGFLSVLQKKQSTPGSKFPSGVGDCRVCPVTCPGCTLPGNRRQRGAQEDGAVVFCRRENIISCSRIQK